MSKASSGNEGSDKYVTLKIYSKRRLGNLFLSFFALICISALIVFNKIKFHQSLDVEVASVALLLVFFLCFLPLSEEWSYAPWQDAPRKLEQEIQD